MFKRSANKGEHYSNRLMSTKLISLDVHIPYIFIFYMYTVETAGDLKPPKANLKRFENMISAYIFDPSEVQTQNKS